MTTTTHQPTDREKALNKFNELLLEKSQQIINGNPFLFYASVLDRETVETIEAALTAKDEVQTVTVKEFQNALLREYAERPSMSLEDAIIEAYPNGLVIVKD